MIAENLAQIVGAENVDLKPAVLDDYSQDMSLVQPVRPAAVVRVKTLAEVQKLIKMAGATQTPLIPVSSGGPHFRGDTVPATGGAVIVDLSAMKKIIHISRKNRMAMFEPGVNFGELKNALAREGMRLNMPLAPRATKSVLGSLLEREPVTMPIYHWDIGDPTGCFEIIWGNGELYRTGAAAGSGTIEEQWAAGGSQKEAAGPSSSSWYRLIQGAQGTMGIVTWGTCRLEVLPELQEPFFIGSSSIRKLTDALHWLVRLRLANECFVLNNTDAAALIAPDSSGFVAVKESLPPWVLFFNVAAYHYFPEERIRGQLKDLTKTTQKIGVEPVKSLGKLAAGDLLPVVQNPSADPYWKVRQKGNCQDIFFITIYDRLEEIVQTLQEIAVGLDFPATDIGIYLQPVVQGVNCHCEFNLFYNSENPRECDRVKEISRIATRKLMEKGAFFSRPYGENTGLIMNRDAATVSSLRKIKNITDPLNIMNPGKLCF
jgi:FAD/FMN-containing dehydrogenase